MSKTRILAVASVLALIGGIGIQQFHPVAAQAQDQPTDTLPAKQADKTSQAIFESLMGSIEDDTYADFLALGDEKVKVALTKDIFESVVGQVAPRLKSGYSAEYLGNLNQLGFKMHLWKITFKDGGDDMLCQMSLKDARVGGFFLR